MFMAWLLATVSESHIIVMMEFKMKERNMFLWREILWQLRLLAERGDVLIKVYFLFLKAFTNIVGLKLHSNKNFLPGNLSNLLFLQFYPID